MKIRIQKGSIRFRLKQPEVEYFKRNGAITEELQIGSKDEQKLCFILRTTNVDSISVKFDNSTTTILVPQTITLNWAQSAEVGFHAVINITDLVELKVLVEKDFECLDRPDEENVGAYPNPAKQCQL